jgi:hypothetical protein
MARRRGGLARQVDRASKRVALSAAISSGTDAGRVAEAVYEAALRVERSRGEGSPPVWLLAALEYLGTEVGARIVRAHGLDPGLVPEVAAYVASGLYDLVAATTAEFDEDHFNEWRKR